MGEAAAAGLQRVLGPTGVTLLTLSALSPGASVLVAGGDILHQAGTGAALAFLLGGILTLMFTFAQAELGSSFPLAGGDYATIGNALGPRAGFAQFGIVLLAAPVFLGISASGTGLYLHLLLPAVPAIALALAAIVLATGIAILNIRTGAILTGAFLMVELAALGLIAGLGFLHPARSLAAVFASPAVVTASATAPLSLGALGLAIAAASWATSGAGQAIYFSEEMHAPKSVGRLVIGIVLLTVIFEFLPVLGIVIGAGDLKAVFSSDAPFIAFFAEGASSSLATLLTLGIIAVLFNALVSGLTCYGRFVYSSGRDGIWSEGINGRDDRVCAVGAGLLLSRIVDADRPSRGVWHRAVGAAQRGGDCRTRARAHRRARHLSRAAVPTHPCAEPLRRDRAGRNRLDRHGNRAAGHDHRARGDFAVAALPPLRARSARAGLDDGERGRPCLKRYSSGSRSIAAKSGSMAWRNNVRWHSVASRS